MAGIDLSKKIQKFGVDHLPFLHLAQSEITGVGTTSAVALTPQRVTVIAKDSAGVQLTSGGDLIMIEIHNQCTLDTINLI